MPKALFARMQFNLYAGEKLKQKNATKKKEKKKLQELL